jgi:sugar phosphate isomerase/epimerase
MILYGVGDPIEAVEILGKHIRHVHIKDAIASDAPRKTWGREVVFGRGQVGAAAFIKALHQVGYQGPLVVEREGGKTLIGDIMAAIKVLQEAMPASA